MTTNDEIQNVESKHGFLFCVGGGGCSFYPIANEVAKGLVRDSSVVRRRYILLLEPSNVRAQYIRKTADLLLQLWVSTFPRFVAIGFYFLS